MAAYENDNNHRAWLSTNFAGIAFTLLFSAIAIFIVLSFMMSREDGTPVGKKDIDVKVLPTPSTTAPK